MKSYRPTTPSRRGMMVVSYKNTLTTSRPLRSLVRGGKRHVGRNADGRITVRHKGGGHKRRFREVDFRFDKRDVPGRIEHIEYDPNRSGFLARVLYADGERRYILAPQRAAVGDSVLVSESAPLTSGNRLPLGKIPVGTFVYNIELKPGGGARLARAAGNYAEVVAQEGGYTHLKMPSTEIRKVFAGAWASIGEVSNAEHRQRVFGKAGRSRWLGIRPTVRGSAMNPVDHPHGGGEGRAGRGRRRAVSMWGKPTGKGHKTRRAKKYSNAHIIARRRVGKKRG